MKRHHISFVFGLALLAGVAPLSASYAADASTTTVPASQNNSFMDNLTQKEDTIHQKMQESQKNYQNWSSEQKKKFDNMRSQNQNVVDRERKRFDDTQKNTQDRYKKWNSDQQKKLDDTQKSAQERYKNWHKDEQKKLDDMRNRTQNSADQ